MPLMAISNSVTPMHRHAMYSTVNPNGIEIAKSANRANFEVPKSSATRWLLAHTAAPISARRERNAKERISTDSGRKFHADTAPHHDKQGNRAEDCYRRCRQRQALMAEARDLQHRERQ